MSTQDPLDTLEDAVVAKANREYVMVSRECVQQAIVALRGRNALSGIPDKDTPCVAQLTQALNGDTP